MKNTVSYYNKKSKSLVSFAMLKHGAKGKLEYALYCAVSFIAKLFVFLRPIFVIADTNIATMIDEGHDFNLAKAFDGVKKRYFSLLIAMIAGEFKALIIYAAVYAVGLFLVHSSTSKSLEYVIARGAGHGVYLLAVVLGIRVAISYVGCGFVSAKAADVDAGDIILNSKQGVKGSRFAIFSQMFLNYFIRSVFFFAILHFGRILILSGERIEFYRNGEPFLWISKFGGMLIYLLAVVIYYFVYVFIFAPAHLKYEQFLYSVFKDSIRVKKTIVVKEICGETQEFAPIFTDDKNEKDTINLNK